MSVRVRTVLDKIGPAAHIELTDEQVAKLGGGKRAAVRVTIGERPAPLRLAVMGGQNVIGLSKASRDVLGVDYGDEVEALVELDESPREIPVPDDLAAALVDAGLREAFDALAPSHRKEHARAIEEAKKPETRARRVEAAVATVREKAG